MGLVKYNLKKKQQRFLNVLYIAKFQSNPFFITICMSCYQFCRLISNPMKRMHTFYFFFKTRHVVFLLFVLLLFQLSKTWGILLILYVTLKDMQ